MWIHRRFREEDAAASRINVQTLFAECVVPHVNHVLPIADHAVVHGVGNFQHVAQLTCFLPNHQILKENERDGVGWAIN